MKFEEPEGFPNAMPRSQWRIRLRSTTTRRERTQTKIAARPPPLCPLMFTNVLSLIVQSSSDIMSIAEM